MRFDYASIELNYGRELVLNMGTQNIRPKGSIPLICSQLRRLGKG